MTVSGAGSGSTRGLDTESGFVFASSGKPAGRSYLSNTGRYRDHVEGEATADSQPFPLLRLPSRAKRLPRIWRPSEPGGAALRAEQLRKVRSGGSFIPPSLEGTVVFPGFDGGGEWGGPAFDPETGLLYVNSNEMTFILRLVRRPGTKGLGSSGEVYSGNCASCHRADRRGSPPEFPSLVGIGKKYKEEEISKIMREGRGRCQTSPTWGGEVIEALARLLATGQDTTLPRQSRPSCQLL